MEIPFIGYESNDPTNVVNEDYDIVSPFMDYPVYKAPIQFKDIDEQKEDFLDYTDVVDEELPVKRELKYPKKRMSKSQFKKEFMPYAKKAAEKLGIDPLIILTQAYFESGGNPNSPMFGIKAEKGYRGKSESYMTKEEINGKLVDIRDSFRKYDHPGDAFEDYGNFIAKGRYRNALGKDPLNYFTELKKAGYATDSGYVNKLMSVYKNMQEA